MTNTHQEITAIDLIDPGLTLKKLVRGSRMAETVPRPRDEPLEPDAGNAAEGRSGPSRTGSCLSHAFFRAWLFCSEQNELGKEEIRKNYCFTQIPFFLRS